MKLAKAEQMREMDRRAIEEFGIPGVVLMENAGLALLNELRDMALCTAHGDFVGLRVCIICGPGNNGGDGFVVARHAANLGARPDVIVLADVTRLKGDALINYEVLEAMGPGVVAVTAIEHGLDGGSPPDLEEFQRILNGSDIVVDAVFGTGFTGELPEGVRAVAELVRCSGKPVLSADLPTGLDANTGRVAQGAIRATRTVTFGLLKVGLALYPGKSAAGRTTTAYIGLPPVLLSSPSLTVSQLTLAEARKLLPTRLATDHKGSYGKVTAVAGSPGLTGAAYLAATAAVRVGAGLVTLCIPNSLNTIMEIKTTESMTRPCPETETGTFAFEASTTVIEQLGASTSAVIGPGLGRHPDLRRFVSAVIASSDIPILVDADALNQLDVEALASRANQSTPVVLTPHPGELARLLGTTIPEVEENRMEVALCCAQKWKAHIVLKGAATLVVSPDGLVYVNPTGNQGMATGGSGDVLSGIIGGLLAQGMKPLEACALGAFIHGLAGDLAAKDLGMASMAAGDLLDYLPRAFVHVEGLHEA